jgi:hypothetical protein
MGGKEGCDRELVKPEGRIEENRSSLPTSWPRRKSGWKFWSIRNRSRFTVALK